MSISMVTQSTADCEYQPLRIPEVAREHARCTIFLYGDQDASSVQKLRDLLFHEISAIDGGDVVADLADVTFIDASTLGALVTGRVYLNERGRRLMIQNASSCARRLLDVCELNDMFAVDILANSVTELDIPTTVDMARTVLTIKAEP